MNREQRRRQEKLENRKITMKEAAAISQAAAEIEKERASNDVINTLHAATLMVLHDKFGFGAKRLDQFRLEVYEAVGAICSRHLSLKDIDDMLREEVYKGQPIKDEEMLVKERRMAG